MTLQKSSPLGNEQHVSLVLALDDASAQLLQVGGKGASLARMAAAGLPVPPGFYVTTAAYRRFVEENGLQEKILAAVSAATGDDPTELEEASRQIGQLFAQGMIPDEIAAEIVRAYGALGGGDLPVAVRSSATAEDLPEMSFAGQQETYLNMQGDVMVLDAVKRCWASLWTARAIGYRARHGIAPEDVSLAVVVQELVAADAAGILFTANPLSGAREQVMINAAWGLGEAIVGGLVTPDTIVVEKASGAIIQQDIAEKDVMTVRTAEGTHEEPVPADKRKTAVLTAAQATELASIGVRIEELYGQPMDIEWAMKDGRFSIVQARPITTLRGDNVAIEEWNDSLASDSLWTNGNLGEAVPDVMTPCTWSLIEVFMSEATSPMFAKGIREYQPIGNIGGRFYLNMSLTMTIAKLFGIGQKGFKASIEEAFGRVPDGLEIPLLSVSRWHLLRAMLPIVVRLQRRVRANMAKLPAFFDEAPAHCETLQIRIQAASSTAELIDLWQTDLGPFFRECSGMLEAVTRQDRNSLVMVRGDLRKLVGEADANALLSGLSVGANHLASLGLLVGLAQLEHGEIDRATFVRQYGHRCPHEFEVSLPRPVEDPDWIDQQLAALREAPVDVQTLLTRQQEAQATAWKRFQQRYPRKAARMRRRIDKAVAVFHEREVARSEVIRVFRVLRAFVLRAGELTGLGDALFFLSIDEVLAVLGGDEKALAHIPARSALYERYRALPAYPTLIRGHFDPFKWATDPQRRSDVFDASGGTRAPESSTITGFPGVEGVVEGRARVIATAEEGDQLQPGEILVTIVTNVGWTPLFPRAAAIVTDVGAPLSHAAIVARELGIPAVVGCGNATMRLHSGDWVRVDGRQGTVELLRRVNGVDGVETDVKDA
ncbi:MAG: PEP/pyruvate-binding domain-containing protein [Ktedonobacteraceae bacterium]